MAAGLAHVETLPVGAAVYGEGIAGLFASLLEPAHVGDVEAYLDESGITPVASLEELHRSPVESLHEFYAAVPVEIGERSLPGTVVGEQDPAETALPSLHQGEVGELPGLVVDHGAVAEHVAVEAEHAVDVGRAYHSPAYPPVEGMLLDVYRLVLEREEVVAPGVPDEEAGRPRRSLREFRHAVVFCEQLAPEALRVAGLDDRRENPEVAGLHIERAGNGLALGVLPYLEAASALEVHRDAGVPLLGLPARVAQHPLRHRVVLQHPHVHVEHFRVPFPRLREVLDPHAYLLYA